MRSIRVWALPVAGIFVLSTLTLAEDSVGDSPYFPLKVGTVQTYRFPGAEVQVRVARHEMFEGKLCARLETYVGATMQAFEHVRIDLLGATRHGFNGNKIDPPMLVLVVPPKPDDTWKVSSKLMGQSVVGTFTTSKEQVTTAAGIFECIVVKSEDLVHGKQKLVTTNWYAPKVGLVKQSVKMGERVVIGELSKFQPSTK